MLCMSRYVAITESEMSDFMDTLGFTELTLEERGSFGRSPVKERVYETPVGAGRIRVYSTVAGAVGRASGKDAIRVQYWIGDQKVYGAKRVHRTKNWRKNLLQRTEEIRDSVETGPLSRIPKDSRGDLMTARRGRLPHERFWGSVNYPDIRESRRFEAVSVLPKELSTDRITDRVMAIQYMMDDSDKQYKLLQLQTALKMGLITEDEILEKLDMAMKSRGMSAETISNISRKNEKQDAILEHLNVHRQTSKYDGKFENTEGGIVELLGITRAGVSKTLRDMESQGLIYNRKLHVPGDGKRKVQCWFVVGSGVDRGFRAETIYVRQMGDADQERIENELRSALKTEFQDMPDEEIESLVEIGMDSRLSDLDDVIDVELFAAESYKPPASAVSAAKKGLAQRKKWGRGGLSPAEAKSQGIDSGVTRARKIASGKVSKHDVRRMSAFNRHRKNNRPEKKMPDGGPTAGTIAWNLWGGTSGVNWAKKKSAAMNAETFEAYDVASWNPADEPSEEEAVWEQFYEYSPDMELTAKLWDLEGQPGDSAESWMDSLEGTDEHENVFERHYQLIKEAAYRYWDKMYGAEDFEAPVSCDICGKTFDSFRGLNGHMNAHLKKRAEGDQFPSMHYGDYNSDAQEKYQEMLDEWDLDNDPPSFEEWVMERNEYDRRLQEYQDSVIEVETFDAEEIVFNLYLETPDGDSVWGGEYYLKHKKNEKELLDTIEFDLNYAEPDWETATITRNGKVVKTINYEAETFEASIYTNNFEEKLISLDGKIVNVSVSSLTYDDGTNRSGRYPQLNLNGKLKVYTYATEEPQFVVGIERHEIGRDDTYVLFDSKDVFRIVDDERYNKNPRIHIRIDSPPKK